MKLPPPVTGLALVGAIFLCVGNETALAQFNNIQMPVAGYVTVHYDSANSFTNQIPPASHIVSKLANRVKVDTSITGRLRRVESLDSAWSPCTSEGGDPATFYRYGRDTTHPETEWQFFVSGVLPNEQLALVCSTVVPTVGPIGMELKGSGNPDTVGQTLVWRRYFETDDDWYCNPSYKFNQKVYISIVLSPDTVVRYASLDSNNVYPYYPAIRNDTLISGVKKRYMDLEIKAAFGDSLLRDYFIKVEKPQLVDSGGHSHGGARPLATYRVVNVSGSGFDIIDSSFTRKTDSTGGVKFRFLASQFGGSERIKARAVSETTRLDTVKLITKVPGLELLPTGTTYLKYGGTCDHHGPQAPSGCTMPDTDHWGISDLIESITAIADSFSSYYSGFRIRVNDMSLPLGGGFDVGGNWITDIIDQYPNDGVCNDVGHCEHREGTVADISFAVVNPSGQVVAMTPEQRERILGLIRHVVGEPLEHGHYHIGQE